jgi:hypothetical protein
MHPFDTDQLLLPSVAIFLFTLLIGLGFSRRTGIAIFAALTKSACFFFYFNVFFDGTYWIRDDWRYLRVGQYLHEHVGLNFLGNLPLIISAAGGDNFLYYVYNTYAVFLFGDGYFAPVALNVLLTPVIAWMGARLAEREFGWQGDLRDAFFFFLLLSPDILAWSTTINGKDITTLFLHVAMLCAISDLYRRHVLRGVLLLTASSVSLLFLRFYVPLLFAAAFMTTSFLAGRKFNRAWWFVAGFAVMAVLGIFQYSLIVLAATRIQTEAANPLIGFPRFLLTPIPFNIEPAYGFLELPAIFHWLMLPFLVLGIFAISRLKTPFVRFFLAYIALFAGLYSVYSELQGPRHRVQLDFGIAILQFAGILYAAQIAARHKPAQELQP